MYCHQGPRLCNRKLRGLDAYAGWGSAIYSATLPELAPGATLTIDEAHDYARVFVGDEYVGTLDRRLAQKTLTLPHAVKAGSRLTILVEGMGRVNFGQAIVDYKGITCSVKVQTTADGHLATYELRNWDISLVPDDYQTAAAAFGNAARAQASAHRFPADDKVGLSDRSDKSDKSDRSAMLTTRTSLTGPTSPIRAFLVSGESDEGVHEVPRPCRAFFSCFCSGYESAPHLVKISSAACKKSLDSA